MDITELFENLLSDGEDRVELASIDDADTYAALVKFVKDAGRAAMADNDIELAKSYGTILTAVQEAQTAFAAEQEALGALADAFAEEIVEEEPVTETLETEEVVEEEAQEEEAFEVEVEAETEEVVVEEALETSVEDEPVTEAAEEFVAEDAVEDESVETLAQEDGADMAQNDVDIDELAATTPAEAPKAEDTTLGAYAFRWMTENPGYTAGAEVESLRDLAEAIVAKTVATVSRGNGVRTDFGVAQMDYSPAMGESAADTALAISEQFAAIRNAADRGEQNALVASGGLCAAPERFYDFCRINQPEHLVQDFLPALNVPRGAIEFYVSPDIRDAFAGGDSVDNPGNAEDISKIYTIEDDENAVEKTCVRFPCPVTEECQIEAQYVCLQFGNIQTRAFPEWVEHWIALALDVHAHVVSAKLMAQIEALVDDVVTADELAAYAGGLGATATIFSTLDLAVADYRHDLRTGSSLRFEAIIPSWGFDMIRADLTKAGMLDSVSDATIRSWFAQRGIDVRMVTDWYAVDAVTDPAEINGYDAAGAFQPAGGEDGRNDGASGLFEGATGWSDEFPIIFFPRGTFVKLDMGTLDLGIVRDSMLNRTNDYQLFLESFESVCKPGCSDARRYNIPVCVGSSFSDRTVYTCA